MAIYGNLVENNMIDKLNFISESIDNNIACLETEIITEKFDIKVIGEKIKGIIEYIKKFIKESIKTIKDKIREYRVYFKEEWKVGKTKKKTFPEHMEYYDLEESEKDLKQFEQFITDIDNVFMNYNRLNDKFLRLISDRTIECGKLVKDMNIEYRTEYDIHSRNEFDNEFNNLKENVKLGDSMISKSLLSTKGNKIINICDYIDNELKKDEYNNSYGSKMIHFTINMLNCTKHVSEYCFKFEMKLINMSKSNKIYYQKLLLKYF